jgi:hypothetical protein
MFARKVSLQLKPNSVAESTQIIEKDIIRCANSKASRTKLCSPSQAEWKRCPSVCGISKSMRRGHHKEGEHDA